MEEKVQKKRKPYRKKRKPSTSMIGDNHHARKRVKEGMDVSVNGKIYKLYQIGKIPEILTSLGFPRTLVTVKWWLTHGIIPDTPIRITKVGKNIRYFPREYIEKLAQIGKESGVGTGVALSSTNFMPRCSLELREILDKLVKGEL